MSDEGKRLRAAEERLVARLRGQGLPPQRPRRKRRPSLFNEVKQAEKAGKTVKGAVVEADRVILQFGEPEPTEASNPWLADMERVTKQ